MLRRERVVQNSLNFLNLRLLDLYPIVQVSNRLAAKIRLLSQPDPSNGVNRQHYLRIIFADHCLASDLFIDILDKDGLNEIAEFLLDLLFG